MQLRDWLFIYRVSIIKLAKDLEVDRSYIHKWLSGSHVPADIVMQKLATITKGKVTQPNELKDLRKEALVNSALLEG